MRISAKSISQDEHRYPTLGDYWEDDDGSLEIRTTHFKDWRHEFLILLHEQVEFMLCRHRGVSEEEIKQFDEMFEASGEVGEPGDRREAPYYVEHQFAQAIEMMMAQELDVNWREYEEEQDRVWKGGQ